MMQHHHSLLLISPTLYSSPSLSLSRSQFVFFSASHIVESTYHRRLQTLKRDTDPETRSSRRCIGCTMVLQHY
ncbi:hypothetical protein Hanom_Chr03g00242741 [Helianthus anomalus]